MKHKNCRGCGAPFERGPLIEARHTHVVTCPVITSWHWRNQVRLTVAAELRRDGFEIPPGMLPASRGES